MRFINHFLRMLQQLRGAVKGLNVAVKEYANGY
jgi:hypothetical protein